MNLKNGISYSFLDATRGRVDTLLAPNQGYIELDYTHTKYWSLGKVSAHWDVNKKTYVDSKGKRVKVYDGILIENVAMNTSEVRHNIDSYNAILKELKYDFSAYSITDLFPSLSKKKKAHYERYFSKLQGGTLNFVDDWRSLYVNYDVNTNTYLFNYAIDDLNGSHYNKNLSLDATKLFDGGVINEKYLVNALIIHVTSIVEEYFSYEYNGDSSEEIGSSKVGGGKEQRELKEKTVQFDDIQAKGTYRQGKQTYCGRAARHVAKDPFELNIPKDHATHAIMKKPSSPHYLGVKSFGNSDKRDTIHGVKPSDLNGCLSEARSLGATFIDLGCHSRTKNGQEKIGNYKVGHRFVAFYRPEMAKWYLVDPVVGYSGCKQGCPVPIENVLSKGFITFNKARYYDAPVSVVG